MFRSLSRFARNVTKTYRLKHLVFRFSTNIEQQTKRTIESLNSIPLTNPSIRQIQFSEYRDDQLFSRLEQLSLKKQLSTTQLVQSLNYLEEERYIHPVLYMLYPHLNSLSDSSLVFVFQKIFAYKPSELPEIPEARMITNNQMLFFILSQLYEPKKLVKWIQKVPFWEETNRSLAVLSMGVFTAYQKMSKAQKELYSKQMNKCNDLIEQCLNDGDIGDSFISILALSLQLNNPLAEKILKDKSLHFQQISAEHLIILFMNMSSYSPNGEKSKVIEELLNEVVVQIIKLDWKKQLTISLMDLWNTFYKRTGHKGVWVSFSNKLINFTIKYLEHENKQRYSQQDELTAQDLIRIVQTLDKHYINKKQLLREVLILLQSHLETMPPENLVRLVKSLTIYVKIEQIYFMHLRKVCDRRKPQFSASQIKQLKNIYAKFQILFSMPF